jgi:nucleoside-diphosphate-sugar epimerase
MRVLAIGGSGFIGPWVVGILVEQGHDVAVYHRAKSKTSLPNGVRQIAGTVLRLPMVCGPGDMFHRLHPYLKRMDDGRPGILIQARS